MVEKLHELIDDCAKVEKFLTSLKDTIKVLYILNREGDPIIECVFDRELMISSEMTGGLIAAINGFAGHVTPENIRDVVLQEVHFKFTSFSDDHLLAEGLTKDHNAEHVTEFLHAFQKAISLSYEHERSRGGVESSADMMRVALLKVFQLIDEDLTPLYQLDLDTELNLELVEYEASKAVQEVMTAYQEFLKKPEIPLEEVIFEESEEVDSGIVNEAKEMVEKVLTQFVTHFEQILQIIVLRVGGTKGYETIEIGNFEEEKREKVLSTLIENLGTISALADGQAEDKILQIDDIFVYLQKVSDDLFMFLFIEDKGTVEVVVPIIERISTTIENAFGAAEYLI